MRILRFFLLSAFALAGLFAASAQGGKSASSVPAAASGAAIRLPVKLDYRALADLLADPSSRLLLLDVRSAEEFAAGHIPGALLAPYDALEAGFKEADKARPIVVYCRSGRRSAIALDTLRRMGYSNLSDFGAVDNWKGKLAR